MNETKQLVLDRNQDNKYRISWVLYDHFCGVKNKNRGDLRYAGTLQNTSGVYHFGSIARVKIAEIAECGFEYKN